MLATIGDGGWGAMVSDDGSFGVMAAQWLRGELARGIDTGEREGREMVVDGGETVGGLRWLVLVRVS